MQSPTQTKRAKKDSQKSKLNRIYFFPNQKLSHQKQETLSQLWNVSLPNDTTDRVRQS